MRAPSRSQGGFSLLEVVFAVGVLAILLLGLGATTLGTVQSNELMQERRVALNQAQSALNLFLADPSLADTFEGVGGAPVADVPPRASPGEYDLASRGLVAPPELNEWEGTLQLHSYQFDQPAGSVPSPWNDFAAGAKPFAWEDGEFFKVQVTIAWRPASNIRSNDATKLSVTVESLYYPPPPEAP